MEKIKVIFVRVNKITDKMSQHPKATFVKEFNSIEEYINFVFKCNYAVRVVDFLTPEQRRVYRSKAFAYHFVREREALKHYKPCKIDKIISFYS